MSWRSDNAAKAGGTELVSKKEEEGLITLMKERALVQCKQSQKDYYECVKGRMISVAWEQADGMSDCLGLHTSDEVLADLKVRWAKAGKPSIKDRSKVPKF